MTKETYDAEIKRRKDKNSPVSAEDDKRLREKHGVPAETAETK